ncbi:MAG: leucyl aminopeptidase [Rickettsiales bacterium]|nr:leucyl aminopeptidase [Rickettsiales bacterium]
MMKIKFIKDSNKVFENTVIILDKKSTSPPQAGEIKKHTGVDLNKLIKLHKYKANQGECCIIPTTDTKIKNIILFGIGDVKKATMLDLIKSGSKLYNYLVSHSIEEVGMYLSVAPESLLNDFMLGMFLGSYKFDKYRTVKRDSEKNKTHLKTLTIAVDQPSQMNKILEKCKDFAESTALVKDLVSEPANVINPSTLSKICTDLSKSGIKVQVLEEAKLKKLGMNALLGVGQGSTIPSKVVVMHWQGAKSDKKKIALVGKGVTFDSGGLSLKPPSYMEDMKGDMAGAATVIGMMRMLALRKAKVNVIGAVGLVENMPSGDAQKPGDIVKSMSGQTIEVLNTDAEGRLVLADVLWYIQDNYKPTVMIDLATLTGAVRICLADKMAGLFSNNEILTKQLLEAGKETGEVVWNLPLDAEYDKMMDSEIADMRNIAKPSDGSAGSTTAAQFLQRFVNKTPWAHIDIASVSERTKSPETGASGPTAFGMRLLNKFIEDNYEK